MFYTFKIKKPTAALPVILLIAAVIMIVLTIINVCAAKPAAQISPFDYCLVIDAGHGGIDGGAVSAGGKKESDINLAIALRLQAIAEFCGVSTVMTRTDDKMRSDIVSYSEREDLIHRTEIINSAPNGVLISIHQNCYPTIQPHGAQVLYAASDGSKSFGEIIHSKILAYLEPESRRVCEPASSKLYITSHVECPAVLMECGFMSNFSDVEKLITTEYQTSLALVFFTSFVDYSSSETAV